MTQSTSLEFGPVEYVGIAAGSFAVAGGFHQLWETYRLQTASHISYWFVLGLIASTSLWVYYHWTKKGGGPFLTTTIALVGLLLLLGMKIVFDLRDRRKTPRDSEKEESELELAAVAAG